jgi:hypothetical protein
MDVIVADCLILTRLAQRRVLEEAIRLPHEVIIPDVMFVDQLSDLGGYDRPTLVDLGARVGRLDGDGVAMALTYRTQYPALGTTETFSLVMAEAASEESVLLTDAPPLIDIAEAHGLDARGLPWIFNEIHRHGSDGVAPLETPLWRGG